MDHVASGRKPHRFRNFVSLDNTITAGVQENTARAEEALVGVRVVHDIAIVDRLGCAIDNQIA